MRELLRRWGQCLVARAGSAAFGILLGSLVPLLSRSVPPRLVVDPEILDVAMTFPADREIHLNPIALQLLPATLSTFLLQHEQAHVLLGHDVQAPAARRRGQELEADCWAAQHSTPSERLMAIRFLEALGHVASQTHPSGTMRAAAVLRCSR